jgi:hypothetical protein
MDRRWLTGSYWETIKWNGYDYLATQKNGVGSGEPKTPTELPNQVNLST